MPVTTLPTSTSTASRHLRRSAVLWLSFLLFQSGLSAESRPRHAPLPGTDGAARHDGGGHDPLPERIQQLVDRFRTDLSIPEAVTVTLVPANALAVSVERASDRPGAFVLSVEADFVRGLNDDELGAVVAHELGHVWIFTHHPYLQTEQLANRIAMRLVSRDSLVRVYEKVWVRVGTKGDLVRFLGQ